MAPLYANREMADIHPVADNLDHGCCCRSVGSEELHLDDSYALLPDLRASRMKVRFSVETIRSGDRDYSVKYDKNGWSCWRDHALDYPTSSDSLLGCEFLSLL